MPNSNLVPTASPCLMRHPIQCFLSSLIRSQSTTWLTANPKRCFKATYLLFISLLSYLSKIDRQETGSTSSARQRYIRDAAPPRVLEVHLILYWQTPRTLVGLASSAYFVLRHKGQVAPVETSIFCFNVLISRGNRVMKASCRNLQVATARTRCCKSSSRVSA